MAKLSVKSYTVGSLRLKICTVFHEVYAKKKMLMITFQLTFKNIFFQSPHKSEREETLSDYSSSK